MDFLSELLFCCSVSLDGFTIGCCYGMRKLRSTIATNIIAAVVCGLASALAIFFGKFFLKVIPQSFCTLLGIAILVSLGLYTVIKGLRIPKDGTTPDFDRQMNFRENLMLSLAVSIDAFSAGLGYAMMGHTSYSIPIWVGIFHSLFITLGISFSRHAVSCFNLSKRLLTVVSGTIIVLIALSRLFL